jgi:hypothetical protein
VVLVLGISDVAVVCLVQRAPSNVSVNFSANSRTFERNLYVLNRVHAIFLNLNGTELFYSNRLRLKSSAVKLQILSRHY